MHKNLKILLVSDALMTLALAMIGPIYAVFVLGIGGDILDASWAYFAFLITTGIVIYFIGKWEDRVKHKEKLITFGYALTAVGCLLYFFVDSQLSLVITQIVLGFAEAIQIPAYDAMYTHFVDKKHSASEWANWESLYYFMTAIGALVGGFIAKMFGFRILFLVMFGISLFGTFHSLLLRTKTKRRAKSR